jgi:predicted metallopeptidase
MVYTIHMIWVQQLHTQPLWWIEQLKIIFKKTSKQEKI